MSALADALGATEATEAVLDPFEGGCTWSGCTTAEPLILLGEDVWCLEHALDDALPPMESGEGIRACEQCGHGTAVRLVGGPPLHPGCRRDHQARRVRVPPKGASGKSKLKGAYARRARRG